VTYTRRREYSVSVPGETIAISNSIAKGSVRKRTAGNGRRSAQFTITRRITRGADSKGKSISRKETSRRNTLRIKMRCKKKIFIAYNTS